MNRSYKLYFYVPQSHLDSVKCAVFEAGAGRQGNYEQCCWQVLGEGQFRPVRGASPFIGEQDKLSQIEEYKVEMLCDAQVIELAVAALKAAHPYEEPAYGVLALEDM